MAKVTLKAYEGICGKIRGGYVNRDREAIIHHGCRFAFALAADGHAALANELYGILCKGCLPMRQEGRYNWYHLTEMLPLLAEDPVDALVWLAQLLVNCGDNTMGQALRKLLAAYTPPAPRGDADDGAEELPASQPTKNGRAKAAAK